METQQGYEAHPPPRPGYRSENQILTVESENLCSDELWKISVLSVCLELSISPPPQKKKQVGVGRPHPQAPPPPPLFRACACCGTVCAVIYEVDNTKTRSEPKV